MSIEGHGLTARENQIMDLDEAGLDHAAIADLMAVKPSYVKTVIDRYTVSGGNSFDDMVRAGSAALLAAIERTGQRFA